MVYSCFLSQKAKMASKIIKKALGFHYKLMPDHDSSKSGNSSSVSQFLRLRKRQRKYLIKPMENGYFWSQFREMYPKASKQHYVFTIDEKHFAPSEIIKNL